MRESFVVTITDGSHERTIVLLNVHPLASLVDDAEDAMAKANWDNVPYKIIDVRRIDLLHDDLA